MGLRLWAAHLPPELGGGGFGQVKLMLCERAVSPGDPRVAAVGPADDPDMVATSAAEMATARLLTPHAAWTMDTVGASTPGPRST
ncbi:MAG: hypothetical protein ACR2G2_12215 [Pseudonocardia sp.]